MFFQIEEPPSFPEEVEASLFKLLAWFDHSFLQYRCTATDDCFMNAGHQQERLHPWYLVAYVMPCVWYKVSIFLWYLSFSEIVAPNFSQKWSLLVVKEMKYYDYILFGSKAVHRCKKAYSALQTPFTAITRSSLQDSTNKRQNIMVIIRRLWIFYKSSFQCCLQL